MKKKSQSLPKTTSKKQEHTPTQTHSNTKQFSHSELLAALYLIYDAFERANIPFFALDETAECIMHAKQLSGDKVTVGVRKLDWGQSAISIINGFIPPIEEDEIVMTYQSGEVPIEVRVIDTTDPMFRETNTVMYESEFFGVPNPFDTYWENREKWQI